MSAYDVLIEQHRLGRSTILIDGEDVSHSVTHARVDLAAQELPVIELRLLTTTLSLQADKAQVTLDKPTHDLLLQLGWTPPT